jgi:hypothetical protein
MGQQVTIENRADAGAIIGAEAAARSAGDGYTVFTADNGVLVYNPALYKKLPCNPGRDFAADRADGGLHARGNPQVAQADSRPSSRWNEGDHGDRVHGASTRGFAVEDYASVTVPAFVNLRSRRAGFP